MAQACRVNSQLLQLFPREQLAQVFEQHQAEFNTPRLSCPTVRIFGGLSFRLEAAPRKMIPWYPAKQR